MTTTKEILAELKSKGFQVIQHPDRELYIAYSERRLLHTGCGISETSIEWLKENMIPYYPLGVKKGGE